ncbi:MAG: rRNA maturation RNase YbeY [Acidobacteria bacterium]|nr:MAG: rRNA maturation RNase YbeY [Acidobacteriota bacterium]
MESDAGPPGPQTLRVIVTDIKGRPVRDPGVVRWLHDVAPRAARGVMGLVLAGDGAVRRLNRDFAGEDHATAVLSFPSGIAAGADRRTRAAGDWLGDVVIATGFARRQARAAGHAVRSELRLLALHGLLHLLGHDHETDAGEMARLEKRLRRRGGLESSLTERGGAGSRQPGTGRRS